MNNEENAPLLHRADQIQIGKNIRKSQEEKG